MCQYAAPAAAEWRCGDQPRPLPLPAFPPLLRQEGGPRHPQAGRPGGQDQESVLSGYLFLQQYYRIFISKYHMSSFRDSYLCLSILILSSELKELVEKQTQVIVNMQGKLEECGKNLDSTTSDLEKTKLENKRMREELNNQNAKFQDMFGILQQEDKDIVATFLKQKVDIDNHRESLKKFMELLCEETEKNKNSINNITNFSQNTSVKVDELTEKVALRQVKFLSSLG